MFEVGDVIRVPHGRFGDRYRVIDIEGRKLILRNVRQTSKKMNFESSSSGFIYDEAFLRKKKLNKICSRLGIR
jgi:hypothetical protein